LKANDLFGHCSLCSCAREWRADLVIEFCQFDVSGLGKRHTIMRWVLF
jgi:hypothetical protein